MEHDDGCRLSRAVMGMPVRGEQGARFCSTWYRSAYRFVLSLLSRSTLPSPPCLMQSHLVPSCQTKLLHRQQYSHPSLEARRFRLSSLSPWLRTKPLRGKWVALPTIIRPFSSTSATEICTELWSLDSIRRPVAAHLRGTYRSTRSPYGQAEAKVSTPFTSQS